MWLSVEYYLFIPYEMVTDTACVCEVVTDTCLKFVYATWTNKISMITVVYKALIWLLFIIYEVETFICIGQ